MRLIDADELKNEMKEKCKWLCKDLSDIIDNAPTVEPFAEVQYETFREYERPHGTWLCDNNICLDVRCSYCGSYALERGDYPELSKFCPHCGAEMEVKDD